MSYNVVLINCTSSVNLVCKIRKWDIDKIRNVIIQLNKDNVNTKSSNKYYGFHFEERVKHITNEDGKYSVRVEILKSSTQYFVGGYIETIEDIRVKGDNSTLNRMEHGNFNMVVSGIYSNWSIPFLDGDILLD